MLLRFLNLIFISFCRFGCLTSYFHAVGFGAKVRRQVEGVNRRAILGKPQVAKARMVAQQGLQFLTACAEGFWRLPIGEHDGFGVPGHFQNHLVVLGADGIGHFQQSVFIGRAIGVNVADELAAVAPGASKRAGPAQGGIAVVGAGDTRVH